MLSHELSFNSYYPTAIYTGQRKVSTSPVVHGSYISESISTVAILACILAQGTVVVEMRGQLSSLQFLTTFVAAVNLDIAAASTHGVGQVSFEGFQRPYPFTALVTLGAVNLKLVNFSLNGFVQDVGEVLFSAVGANPSSLGPEPLLQASLAVVLPTAGGEVRVAENLGTDRRTQVLLWYLFKKPILISTILGLLRGPCNSHFDQ